MPVVAATGSAPHGVSHSFGAVIALQARSAGVEMRSLVVYEPPINADAIPEPLISKIRDAVEEGRADDAIAMMARDLAGITDEELGVAMAVPPVRKRLRDDVRTAPRELEALHTCSLACLPISVPTLVIRGERTGSAAYPTIDQASDIATGVEFATLPGQGHFAHIFTPTAFGETMRAFLDRN